MRLCEARIPLDRGLVAFDGTGEIADVLESIAAIQVDDRVVGTKPDRRIVVGHRGVESTEIA